MVSKAAVLYVVLFGACLALCARAASPHKRIPGHKSRTSGTLAVGAFNIKTFGRAKMDNEEVADIIKNIVLEYDLILIQEIRDSSGESFAKLLSMLKSVEPYGLAISERLGTTSYKEQYAYFYRRSSLTLLDTHQFPDVRHEFEREPYSALFQPTNGGSGDIMTGATCGAGDAHSSGTPDIAFGFCEAFAVMGLHAKPDHAVEEIGLMADAFNDLLDTWKNPNAIIMGDFNADCSYASVADLEPLPFYSDDEFDWLTPWEADTTTSTNTDCAYDRIVVTGDLKQAVVASSVYQFDKTYDLNFDQMWAVSDHYPVEVIILV